MELNSNEVVFYTHVDKNGKINEGKERFECYECGGSAYIENGYSTPRGTEIINFYCSSCQHEWTEQN